MAAPKTVPLGFRVAPEKAARLEALSEATDRSRSWLLEQALDSFLEDQAWQIAHIKKGIADADAGKFVPHEDIQDWLRTWGKDDEAEPPA